MAQWDKILSRGNVEDRRSLGSTVGGIGITGVLLLMGITYALGGNPMDVLQTIDPQTLLNQGAQNTDTSEFEGKDSYEEFVSTVLGSNNFFWNETFTSLGKQYKEPKLVLFRGGTSSACGGASSAVGPHYCPSDEIIYLDETFFDELQNRFGATGGDVAEAYVLAHEVGHHVQGQLGDLENRDSIAIELQADCYAGMWAGSLSKHGIFEQGEINEAIDAARAVGDDTIQKRETGHVQPELWTHGSSQERVDAFNTGFESISFKACQKYL